MVFGEEGLFTGPAAGVKASGHPEVCRKRHYVAIFGAAMGIRGVLLTITCIMSDVRNRFSVSEDQ
jgi:hypothetical protein